MQLQTRDQALAALRPYRGLEERVFAPTSSYGIRLGDNNDASYQFGKRGDTLPMSNDAWDYVYKIGGLKGVGLDKYPRQLVAPILDEALRRHEKELKAVVREGEIIAFTNAEAQVLDPIHMMALMERGLGGRRAAVGYQVGGGWDRQFITIVGGASQQMGQTEDRKGKHVGDVINYGVTSTFTPLGIDLPSTAVPLDIGGFTHRLVCTNGAMSTQNVMNFTRKEARGDRDEWIVEKVGQVYGAGQFEFDRIRSLPMVEGCGVLDAHRTKSSPSRRYTRQESHLVNCTTRLTIPCKTSERLMSRTMKRLIFWKRLSCSSTRCSLNSRSLVLAMATTL